MALALDGSVQGNSGGSATLSVTLTTTRSPDVICVTFTCNAGPLSSVTASAPGLGTFTQRATANVTTTADFWYAIATQPLTAVSITATQSGGSAFITMTAFGISGANTLAPFDTNASLPASSTPPVSISTSNANDFLIGTMRTASANGTVDSGFTAISNANFNLTEYDIVTATVSSLSIGVTGAGNAAIGDAVVSAPPPVPVNLGFAWQEW